MSEFYDQLNNIDLSWTFMAVAGAVGVMAAIYFVLERFVWRRVKENHENWMRLLFQRFKRPVQLLFFLTVFVIALQAVVPDLDEKIWYQKAYAISVILILSWLAIKGIKLASDLFMRRLNIDVVDNMKARRIYTQVGILRRIVVTVIIFVSIACSLMVFDEIRALGVSLIASAGLGAVVLGLAAQKTLGNFFTGLQIAIAQPIRIGDAVIVEGEWGTIEEINLTYAVVKIWDLRRLILPINYFVDNAFQNWTRNSARLLGPIMLYLDYTMPVDALREELDRILETKEAKELWDGDVKVVQVIDTTEKTMVIRILASARSAPVAWDLRCLIRERLIAFIREKYPDSLPVWRTDRDILEGSGEETAGIPA